MRYSELNPADRAAVDRKLGVSRKKRTTQVAIEGAFRGTCHACGEPFETQASWERHVAANFPGHGRLDQIGGAA